jgi:hypothetical protein
MEKIFRTALISVFCALISSVSLWSQNAKAQAAGSFARVIDNVLHGSRGQDNKLNPIFCQPMRLTTNSENRCPTKQVPVYFGTSDTGPDRFPANFIDVGTDAVSGQIRVVIWNEFRTDAGVLKGIFYVTSASGVLEKVLNIGGGQTIEVPIDAATSLQYEKEKAFWLQQLGGQ